MRPPRGALDPHEDLAFSMEMCRGRAMDALISHGYRPVCPSSLQPLEGVLSALDPQRYPSIIALTSPHGEPCAMSFDVTISAMLKLTRQKSPEERPLRICYAERAFRRPEPPEEEFESYQVGAEIIGWDGEGADCEALFLAKLVTSRMGIEAPVFAVGDPSMILKALRGLPGKAAGSLMGCLRRRDFTSFRSTLDAMGRPGEMLKALPELRGGPEVLEHMEPMVGPQPLQDLLRLWRFAQEAGIDVILDLSLTRNPDYYSGPVFDIYSPHGIPLGGGGRYDGLLRKCGILGQAVGFSIDLKAAGGASSIKIPPLRAMVWCASLPPSKALEFTKRLSQRGIPFEISWHQRPQRSMDVARAKGIRWWLDPSAGLALDLSDKARLTISQFLDEEGEGSC